jgi:hypothetical protein
MARVAVIYYSSTGHVDQLATAIAEGVESAGAEIRLRLVAELVPAEAIEANPAWARFRSELAAEVPDQAGPLWVLARLHPRVRARPDGLKDHIRTGRLVIVPDDRATQGGCMDLKNLQRKAKQLIDRRGGTDSLKADAQELKDIAKGPGSFADKAKRAGDALKDPGAKGPDTPSSPHSSATDEPASPERTAAPSAPPADTPDTSKPNPPPGS